MKVVLGFIVLAFSMKFLLALDPSNKILTRELYLAVWIVLFFLLGLYFLGKLKFSHDSDLPHITVPRLLMSIATFAFVVYLFLGLFGYELKNIAPLLPPKSPNGLDLTQKAIYSGGPGTSMAEQEECTPEKYADLFQMPLGLEGFYDLEEGLACAKAQVSRYSSISKGTSAATAKKWKQRYGPIPQVLSTLRNDFVIVALYTDDRTKLPESEWYTSVWTAK